MHAIYDWLASYTCTRVYVVTLHVQPGMSSMADVHVYKFKMGCRDGTSVMMETRHGLKCNLDPTTSLVVPLREPKRV